jgi:hypothetical protein
LPSWDDYGIIFWGQNYVYAQDIPNTKKRYPIIHRELIPVPVDTGLRNWRF